MMIVRPARENDLEHIFNLAQQAGVGVTTLPANHDALLKKIHVSLQTFSKKIPYPVYLFVLEDTDKKEVIGTAAIDANLGGELPFYSYKLSNILHVCHELNVRQQYEVLYLCNDYQGKTELCTLFLSSDYRKHGNGVLLSRARFLFMAQFSHLFSDTVVAEMRGVSNQQGQSPFWQSLGQHFFQMDFAKADQLTGITNKQFIADLMPQYPIYVNLLNDAARRVIAKAHPDTKPALSMLEKEGFMCKGYIDIFDGGPTIEASMQHIRTIRESELVRVVKIIDKVTEPTKYLLSNTHIDFRVCMSQLKAPHLGQVSITSQIAALLNVDVGDEIRVTPL